MPSGVHKYGRMAKRSPSHQRYVVERREPRNRHRKMLKHLKAHPADLETARLILARFPGSEQAVAQRVQR